MKFNFGMVKIALFALLVCAASASASHRGRSAGTTRDKGDGDGDVCYFAYHILKTGPSRADFGDLIRYRVVLTNIGDCVLRNIELADLIPARTRLVSATPRPSRVAGGRIEWNDFSLSPGRQAVAEIFVQTGVDDPENDRFRITNQACAFTPWIGIRICDSASTWVDRF